MIHLLILLLVTQTNGYDLVNTLLTGSVEEIYKIPNPRKAIINSSYIFNKIRLSNHQKLALWDVFKEGQNPKDLTPEELENVTDLLSSIPEDDLSKLDISNWKSVKILGRVKTFTRPQASVIINSLKLNFGIDKLTKNIHKLSSLICGFSEDELSKIPKGQFKQIDSSVFNKLNACSATQMQTLLAKVTEIYGIPQTWSNDVMERIGMIILALDKDEIRKLRPSALRDLDVGIILKFRPQMLKYFSSQQLKHLNPASKIMIDENFLTSGTSAAVEEITLLMSLFLNLLSF